jgi:hypothetical protein
MYYIKEWEITLVASNEEGLVENVAKILKNEQGIILQKFVDSEIRVDAS